LALPTLLLFTDTDASAVSETWGQPEPFASPVSGSAINRPEVLRQPPSYLQRGFARIVFRQDTVWAEVVYTADERRRGLMDRDDLEYGRGMLFVYDEERVRRFWMKDTRLELDIAYLNRYLRIVDIQQMNPESTDSYVSAKPAMYALEVGRGWFLDHDVQVGDFAQVTGYP